MSLRDIFDKVYFKINPLGACNFKINSIYQKPQEELTFNDVAEYYACRSILKAPKLSPDAPDKNFEQFRKNAADILKAVQRMALYGPNEKIYDYPRG